MSKVILLNKEIESTYDALNEGCSNTNLANQGMSQPTHEYIDFAQQP